MLASPFSIPQNAKKAPCLRRSRAPCYQSLFLDLHPAGQGEGDPVRQLITPALGFFVPADQRFVYIQEMAEARSRHYVVVLDDALDPGVAVVWQEK